MIIIDEKVCGGEPVIKGTRITVTLIKKLYYIEGLTINQICEDYELSRNDVENALNYEVNQWSISSYTYIIGGNIRKQN